MSRTPVEAASTPPDPPALTTSADAALPGFVRSCLRFAERAQATGTLSRICGEPEKARVYFEEATRFRAVAARGLRQRHLLTECAA